MLKYSIHCRKRIKVYEWVQLYYVITENGKVVSYEKRKRKMYKMRSMNMENNKSIP